MVAASGVCKEKLISRRNLFDRMLDVWKYFCENVELLGESSFEIPAAGQKSTMCAVFPSPPDVFDGLWPKCRQFFF